MKKPVNIPHPDLKSAVRLNAAELNRIRFGNKHTVLTPEQLEHLAAVASSGNGDASIVEHTRAD